MPLPNIVSFQRRNPVSSASPSIMRGWDDLHTEMDRLFDSFFGDLMPRTSLPLSGRASSRGLDLDVTETDKAYRITAELPGIDQSEIELSVADGVLTLKGEKRQEEESEGKTFHRVERRYGSFSRSLQLPGDADESQVSATMKNGVLEIEIAKNKNAGPSVRKINIQTA